MTVLRGLRRVGEQHPCYTIALVTAAAGAVVAWYVRSLLRFVAQWHNDPDPGLTALKATGRPLTPRQDPDPRMDAVHAELKRAKQEGWAAGGSLTDRLRPPYGR